MLENNPASRIFGPVIKSKKIVTIKENNKGIKDLNNVIFIDALKKKQNKNH